MAGLADSEQRADSVRLSTLMSLITGKPAVMWGPSIVGFGSYSYVYASGRKGEWLETGFSPRRGKLSIYLMDGVARHQTLLEQLGKHKTAKSCLYLRRLKDVDEDVLRILLEASVGNVRAGDIRY